MATDFTGNDSFNSHSQVLEIISKVKLKYNPIIRMIIKKIGIQEIIEGEGKIIVQGVGSAECKYIFLIPTT